MKTVCSVIIRAYNEEEHLARLLIGIQHQSIQNANVIVVDSGSTDRTVEIARQYGAHMVNIKPHDFTFGRSLNKGIALSKEEIVIIASAHVYPVYPDWLEKLIAPFKDEHVALSYGKQRGSEKSHFSENQLFKHWYPDETQINQQHPFCNNANAAIRRSLWEKHPFDEKLPALEDLAWAKWVHAEGHKISYVAEAEVIHEHQELATAIFNRYKREGMAFKQIYPHENFTIIDVIHLFCTNITSDSREAFRQGIILRQLSNILGFRWNQFWGTFKGYHQSGPLTWQLKRSFYYPRSNELKSKVSERREIKPISYEKLLEKKQSELISGGKNGIK